ncbi:Hypothetical predicted protein [Mytilus galloprovincialis]|uniref:Uncharacterized protein n=1 Tax=Mytilus galloprovincialis TaxID=29158 RepID=A0A8B6BQT7_MYTGA|nr:Hypothetical predicted protein [Mytilus galloprovincialis]
MEWSGVVKWSGVVECWSAGVFEWSHKVKAWNSEIEKSYAEAVGVSEEKEKEYNEELSVVKRELSFSFRESPSPSSSETSLPSLASPKRKIETKYTTNTEEIFYHDEPLLPIFREFKEGVKTRYIVDILLESAGKRYLARSVPNYIDQNVSFIYSIRHTGHWKNCLCDGMGVWHQTGKETKFISVEESGGFVYVNDDQATETTMKVVRRKYVNKSNQHLHRIVIHMEDPRSGVIFNEMFVQYYFDSSTGPTKIEPHGNSTKAKNPYQRTSHSTFAKIKEVRENKTKPKQIFNDIISEQGGLEHVKGSSSIPRNRK